VAPAPSPPSPPSPAETVARQTEALDTARADLTPSGGANTFGLDRQAIAALPQGDNTPIEKVLLQAPGVTQDSKASGDIHVRNEHANLQYRVNGIMLPEGAAGFGQFLETSFISTLNLVTGALPAQYGLRTAGIVDITARTGSAEPEGSIGIYGGSRSTLTPSVEYGGTAGRTQYFFTSRGLWSAEGLENPLPTLNPIHDWTQQGRAFGYTSTLLDPDTRLTTLAGVSIQHFQIPNQPGLPPQFTAFGISDFDSAGLNERQLERNLYGVVALQKKLADGDLQVAYFTRYSSIHFQPDPIGDIIFNGVASDIVRSSFLNGVQADSAWRIDPAHTLRIGAMVSGETSRVSNASTLLPLDAGGNPVDAPFEVTDASSKVGWLIGTYIQDEWRITRQLTLNLGLRFDQMYQYVDANQWSPRASLVWKPVDGTAFHAGYARYFTPPSPVLAAPTNLALVQGTTQQPEVNQSSPVLPERSHYFDVGVDQRILPGLDVGVSAYYKIARDLLDDGQFGAAYVLTAFNYDRAYNEGVEIKVKYERDDFRAYGNLAWGIQKGTNIVSNQFLFGADELAYIKDHYIFTDHAQILTASAGASYKWQGLRFSTDLIYGSGLRNDFANTGHLPGYVQVNAGVSQEFKLFDGSKPTTIRFDVLNVFDHVYELRDGSGIGVFAPQFGQRRAYFVGLSQKF
jgi:outer membrane receptor protein involved in Fe transport